MLHIILCILIFTVGSAVQHHLTGIVTDHQGKPIMSAAVTLTDQHTGVYTDADGSFSLNAKNLPATLRVSMLGYQSRTITVANSVPIRIQLTDSVAFGQTLLVQADRVRKFRPLQRQILQEDIQTAAATTVADVLQSEIGVSFNANQQIMLQGLDPEYTLVIIDGIPVLAGNDDPISFDEIAAGDVQEIEIIRGPSSFIYGRGAVGGVVNISTRHGNQTSDYLRLSAADPTDFQLSGKFHFDISGVNSSTLLSARTFQNPFTTRAESHIQANVRGNTSIGERTVVNAILGMTLQTNEAESSLDNTKHTIRTGLNVNYQPGNGHQLEFKPLFTRSESTFDGSISTQNLIQFDGHYDVEIDSRFRLFTGINLLSESYRNNFLDAFADSQEGAAAFAAFDWRILNGGFTLDWLVGTRADYHSEYAPAFSPKTAVSGTFGDISFRAEIGQSFKSPTFSEMFSSFGNVTYDVIGANLVQNVAQRIDRDVNYLVDPSSLGQLNPENGVSGSVSAIYRLGKSGWTISSAYSFTNLKNYIELVHVANFLDDRGSNHKIFSYRNVSELETRTSDVQVSYVNSSGWRFNAGYQYLDAVNVDDIRRIEQGEVLTRYGNVVQLDDYGGLFNRSRHQLKSSVIKQFSKWPLMIRLSATYRSPYGNRNKENGNFILDAQSEYEDGFTLFDAALTYDVSASLQFQFRAANMGNVINEDLNISGQKFQLNISYSFNKKG